MGTSCNIRGYVIGPFGARSFLRPRRRPRRPSNGAFSVLLPALKHSAVRLWRSAANPERRAVRSKRAAVHPKLTAARLKRSSAGATLTSVSWRPAAVGPERYAVRQKRSAASPNAHNSRRGAQRCPLEAAGKMASGATSRLSPVGPLVLLVIDAAGAGIALPRKYPRHLCYRWFFWSLCGASADQCSARPLIGGVCR